jgi:streptomycin 6-kinase
MPSALPLEPPQRLARSLAALPGGAYEGVEGTAPHGESDAEWLEGLRTLWERTLERWELTAQRVVSPGGRSSLVTLVRQADGTPAALKLLAPFAGTARGRAERERAALERWDGWGSVRLLRAHTGEGALLLERLHGERSLRSLPEAKAMLEAASALRRLWVDAPRPGGSGEGLSGEEGYGDGGSGEEGYGDGGSGEEGYGDGGSGGSDRNGDGPEGPELPDLWASVPTVAAHTAAEAATLRASAPPEALPLREEALQLRAALLEDPPEEVLLHGDFRQGAVLAADAERAPWLAAGPDALLGERAYDLARLVRDRLHDLVASPGAAAATRRRLHGLADSLDVDRERLRGWTLYRAVTSGVRHMRSGDQEEGELLLEFANWL